MTGQAQEMLERARDASREAEMLERRAIALRAEAAALEELAADRRAEGSRLFIAGCERLARVDAAAARAHIDFRFEEAS